jgi:hypothetical protein
MYGGVVSIGAQSFTGTKTFSSDIIAHTLTVGLGGGAISSNTAIGYLVLGNNTTGYYNTGIGAFSQSLNITGYRNTDVGGYTNGNESGFQNTSVGYQAGRSYGIGFQNKNADNSVYIGYNAFAQADNQTNQIVVGASALGNGSNTATWGNTLMTAHYFAGSINATTATFSTIGTGTATSLLGVTSAGLLTTANTLNVITGTGTTNYLPKFTGATTLGDSFLSTDAGGNFYLRKYTDGSKSYILIDDGATYTGSISIQAGYGSASAGGALNLYGASHATHAGDVAIGISATTGAKFRVNSAGIDGGTDLLTIDRLGLTLIGYTSDPTSGNKLAVNGNAYVGGSVTSTSQVKVGSGAGFITLNGNSTLGSGYIEIYKGDGVTRLGYIGYDNTDLGYTAENGAIHKFTGAATFSSSVSATNGYFSSNVGIGTVSPRGALEVVGSSIFTTAAAIGGYYKMGAFATNDYFGTDSA